MIWNTTGTCMRMVSQKVCSAVHRTILSWSAQRPSNSWCIQDDLPEVLQRLERLSSLGDGEVLEFECRLQHRSSEWRWINLRNVVFARDAEGQPIQILGTAQDITDRKQNEQSRMQREEELRRAEQRWTVLLEQKVTERTEN